MMDWLLFFLTFQSSPRILIEYTQKSRLLLQTALFNDIPFLTANNPAASIRRPRLMTGHFSPALSTSKQPKAVFHFTPPIVPWDYSGFFSRAKLAKSFFVPTLSKAISSRVSFAMGVAVKIIPRPKVLCSTLSPARKVPAGAGLTGWGW